MSQDVIIHARERDLGGFSVHRSLPSPRRRQLGPFVFLDHMGPMNVDESHKMDVRPHPHIGLATVTYLFEGRGMHRDSIGSVQLITPGDLNWMTAGRGIVHSERTPQEDTDPTLHKVMHGVQIWVALPVELEECEPSFAHWSKDKLPSLQISPALSAKVLLGQFKTATSPVQIFSETLFIDLQASADCEETLSFTQKEIGVFLAAGECEVDGQKLELSDLAVIADPAQVQLKLKAGARLIVIGGTPFPEERHIWWNFVSSRPERIKQAAEAWKNQSIGQVPGETDFIPLPTS